MEIRWRIAHTVSVLQVTRVTKDDLCHWDEAVVSPITGLSLHVETGVIFLTLSSCALKI